MKKPISIIVAAFIATMTMLPLNGAQDPELIPIIRIPSTPEQELDRGQNQQPFIAEYNDLRNCIVLTCTSSHGLVTVTLFSTAGDYLQTVFDTEDGSILIPVSGNPGHYTILLVTASGQAYEGEFSI